jgi:4-hydroxybenzoate polyprenyltransferase
MNRRLLAYLQLVRLPNVFTAMADIVLGALVTGALAPGIVAGEDLPTRLLRFMLLLGASCCLYCSGMVWNDYFDIQQDERERPFRPLPSGRVTRPTAFALATGLMVAGVVLSALADSDFEEGRFRGFSVWIAVVLCAAILLYDGVLKRSYAGPVGMGACRFLNVLLGLSVYPGWFGRWGILLALVVGVYIVGVTWFARTEASVSRQMELTLAAAVMAVALVLALLLPPLYPFARDEEGVRPASTLVVLGQFLFPFLLVGFGLYLGVPLSRAIRQPAPGHVQKAVKRCVLGLVVLDAILATAFVGPLGLALLVLLLPAGYLGKWVYST